MPEQFYGASSGVTDISSEHAPVAGVPRKKEKEEKNERMQRIKYSEGEDDDIDEPTQTLTAESFPRPLLWLKVEEEMKRNHFL